MEMLSDCEAAGNTSLYSKGETSCDPNCCEQPPPYSGADDCDAATLLAHQIQVPSSGLCDTDADCDPLNNEVCVGEPGAMRCTVQITISGDNTLATYGMCNPGSDDRGWYEAFNFVDEFGAPAQCARVMLDMCCTFDPETGEEPGSAFIIMLRGCSEAGMYCGSEVYADECHRWFCGPDDDNLWNLWEAIPGGVYHYPVLSNDTEEEYPSTLFPYQLHVQVQGCYEYACCLPQDDNCPPALPDKGCIEVNRLECEEQNGFLLTDLLECNPLAPDEYTCELGACCPVPGVCDDNDGAGMLCQDCFLTPEARFYGGAGCIDDPCPVCPFFEEDHCIYDERGYYMAYDDRCSGTPYPRWADDFIAGASGTIERICWMPCFYDPVAQSECHSGPLPDDWQVVFYEEDNGLPGTIIGGPELLAYDGRALSDGLRCWVYTAPVTAGPAVTQGECYWIEITGEGDCDGCQIYWLANGDGNLYSVRDNDGTWGPEDVVLILGAGTITSPYDPYVDMSFCIDLGLGDPEDCGEIPGACYECGEDGMECDPTEVTHVDCRDPWGPQGDPEGIAFFPHHLCGLCQDGTTECTVDEDCPPGEEPCMLPPPVPTPGDNCADYGLFGPILLHDGAPDDPCPPVGPAHCADDPLLECTKNQDCIDQGAAGPCVAEPYTCTFEFDNTCANTDGPDPECGTDFGADIWFLFYTQVDECGWLTIDTCANGTYDGIIAFYGWPATGAVECPTDSSDMQSCGDDTCGAGGGMPCIGDPHEVICPVATDEIYVCQDDPYAAGLNRWYYIRMGGWGGDYGSGQMTIRFEPDTEGCTPEKCPPYYPLWYRPLAEDCATIGDPTCNDGITPCSVSAPCNNPCPPGLEPCTFKTPGTRCQDDPVVPCTSDADCRGQSICIPPPADQDDEPYPYDYYCYAPKTRYLSIKANPEQPPGTARRVKLDDGTVLGWVGEPYANGSDVHADPYMVAEVVAEGDRHYATTWPDVLHIHTCEIAHASLCEFTGDHCKPNNCPGHPTEQCINHRYGVQAIAAGEDIENESAYSDPLWLNTADTWGDTVGGCGGNVCDPPNGQPGLDDIMAAISYFTGCQDVAPLVWLDIDPSNQAQCPEQIVGLGDIMAAIAGFQGAPYPGWGPKQCP